MYSPVSLQTLMKSLWPAVFEDVLALTMCYSVFQLSISSAVYH